MSIEELKTSLNKGEKLFITVRVRPNAVKNSHIGFLADGSLKIAVKAPPDRGLANRELKRLLAEILEIRPEMIAIASGAGSRIKLVRITPIVSG